MSGGNLVWLALDVAVIGWVARSFVRMRNAQRALWKNAASVDEQARALKARYIHDPAVRFTAYCGWTVECEHVHCSPPGYALALALPSYDDAVQLRDRHAANPSEHQLYGRTFNG